MAGIRDSFLHNTASSEKAIINYLEGKYCNFRIIKRGRTSLIKQGSANSPAALNKYYFTCRKANTVAKAIWFDTDPKLHLAGHRTSLGGPAGCPTMQDIPSPRALQQKRPMGSRLIPRQLVWDATASHLAISSGHLSPSVFIQPNLK